MEAWWLCMETLWVTLEHFLLVWHRRFIKRLQIPASSNTIGWNKYEAKESEKPRSPRYELVCHQTLDINPKSDFWD